MGNVKGIKLNSSEIKKFLMNDPAIGKILEEESKKVEEQLLSASRASKVKAGKNKKIYEKPRPVETFNVEGEKHDRQVRHVGINTANKYDFIYGTIPNAVHQAGGKPRRK